MHAHPIRHAVAAALLLLAMQAQAQEGLPAPVNGITFEEWAAGNARLANNQPLDGVLKILKVDEGQWKQADAAFIEELKRRDPGSPTFMRYGEVFANPAVGRFANAGEQPQVEGKLATYDDYARLQADMSAGVKAGKDPQAILKEYGLNTYQYSQESGKWVRMMATVNDPAELERLAAIREKYQREARAKYGLPAAE